jgi:alginate O-acetyltransferase complex protein AlgI
VIFSSIEFLIFLPLVFSGYWLLSSYKYNYQNVLLLISSYIFYGWWDWRFLSLIIFSTLLDYSIGLSLNKASSPKMRKLFLGLSIFMNLGLLAFFKYFNFFVDSAIQLLSSVGFSSHSTWSLKIILPVGISFYTFQTLSYSIDIYRKQLTPTKDLIAFAAYVSFFPQLVAGPIERAKSLLPQMLKPRQFNYGEAVLGLRLILWGMFKKVVIADSLAPRVDDIWNNYSTLGGGELLLGLIYFSIQIYCDFSGYSDIAIGTAKLFGIKLMMNFNLPYFSRNIGEFWRRWHISLSSWFRDYLYIPLGGSKRSKWISIRNVFIVFVVSGLWHGANITFLIWGMVHALLFLPSIYFGTNRKYTSSIIAEGKVLPNIGELFQLILTYALTTLAWVFFRSDSIGESVSFIMRIITQVGWPEEGRSGLIYVIIIIILEWGMRENYMLTRAPRSRILRYAIYSILLILTIGHFPILDKRAFIYFQF